MNVLPLDKRVQIITFLIEGHSLSTISRTCDVSRNTVSKLLIDVGKKCTAFHNNTVINIAPKEVQCTKIWSFVYNKKNGQMNLGSKEDNNVWTWVGIDNETKLVISYLAENNSAESANRFMKDVASRLTNSARIVIEGLIADTDNLDATFNTNASIRDFENRNLPKKIEFHACAIALHFVHYNFCKVHQTLRTTPAIEAGITQGIMKIEDLVNLVASSS